MFATATACTGCQTGFGSTAQPVRLLDLTFHDRCAPSCQACGRRLGGADESRWRYTSLRFGGRDIDRFAPAAFWCPSCWTANTQTAPSRA